LAAALSSCSSHDDVLARVGSQKITVAEFTDVAREGAQRYPFPPDSAKALLLNDLVRRSLMIEVAQHDPTIVDSLVKNYRDYVERSVLVGALAERIAPKDVGVSEAEVRELYEWRKHASHVQLVYAFDEVVARAARTEIDGGADFGAVADKYNPSGMMPPRGDLGFVPAAGLVEPLDQAARETPVGKVVGPMPSPGEGWFLLKVVAREPRPVEPYATEALSLRSTLVQRKQRAVAVNAFKGLRDQYRVAVDHAGLGVFFRRYNAPHILEDSKGNPMAPPPTPDELKAVLGRWDGGYGYKGQFTMKDAMDDLDAGRGGERPNPSMMPAIEQWVTSRIVERVALIEAKRRHLNEEPAIAKKMSEAINNYVLEGMYSTHVTMVAFPTDADMQAAYAHNVASFTELRSVRVQYLTLPDSASAANAFARVQTSPTLRDAILLASPDMQVREETVPYPNNDRLWSMMQGMFRDAQKGAYFGPVHLPEGWRIIQMVDKDEDTPAMSALPPNTQQSLQEEARELARERRFIAYTDSLRQVVPVTIDHERLRRVPWQPVFGGFVPG
jgi:parvulin-like peptidyl-prolyl isomerase